MYGCSSTVTARSPSASEASVSSSAAAASGSFASFHGVRSSTYLLRRRIRSQIASSAWLGSALSSRPATSSQSPAKSAASAASVATGGTTPSR